MTHFTKRVNVKICLPAGEESCEKEKKRTKWLNINETKHRRWLPARRATVGNLKKKFATRCGNDSPIKPTKIKETSLTVAKLVMWRQEQVLTRRVRVQKNIRRRLFPKRARSEKHLVQSGVALGAR